MLSVFGNRTQTNGFVLQELLDPTGLQVLNGPVFSLGSSQCHSLQIVVRVDYLHGVPTGIVYVTHHQRQ